MSAYNQVLLKNLPSTMASVGCPVRQVTLDDLVLLVNGSAAAVNLSAVRAVVFANAFVVTEVQAAAVDALRTPARTLVWIGAPGLLDSVSAPEPKLGRVGALTGLPLVLGWPSAVPAVTKLLWPPALVNTLFGVPQASVSPWFTLRGEDPRYQVLGTLAQPPANETKSPPATLVRGPGTNQHTAVFSANPGLPAALWRAVLNDAGVHLYTTAPGDVVEVAGNYLLVHAGPSLDPQPRTISLPMAVDQVVDMDTGATVCRRCQTFATPPGLHPGQNLLYQLN